MKLLHTLFPFYGNRTLCVPALLASLLFCAPAAHAASEQDAPSGNALASADATGGYSGKVLNKISRLWSPPQDSLNRRVSVRLRIDGNGILQQCDPMTPSDLPEMNKAACAAAKEARSFGPPPYGMPIDVYMTFWTGHPSKNSLGARNPVNMPEKPPKPADKPQEKKADPVKVEAKKPEGKKIEPGKAEAKPEVKAEKKPEPQGRVVKPEPKPETKPEVKAEKKPEPQGRVVKPEPKPGTKPEVKAEKKPESKAEAKVDKKPEPKAVATAPRTATQVPTPKLPDKATAVAPGTPLSRYSEDIIFMARPRITMPARVPSGRYPVEVALKVDHRGQVGGINVTKSSGHESLDQAVVTALTKLGKLSAPPDQKAHTLNLKFSVLKP